MTADHAQDRAGEETGTRRRPHDRGFQRPGGPALVARPEPLATASAPAPATALPASPPAHASAPQPDDGAAAPAREAPTTAAAAKAKQGRGTSLPMPPPRHSELRVQFNTKLRPATITRTKAFADHHQASIQDVVELALDEFFTRRSWPASPDS